MTLHLREDRGLGENTEILILSKSMQQNVITPDFPVVFTKIVMPPETHQANSSIFIGRKRGDESLAEGVGRRKA